MKLIRIANLTLFISLTVYYGPVIGVLSWLAVVAAEKTLAAVFAW